MSPYDLLRRICWLALLVLCVLAFFRPTSRDAEVRPQPTASRPTESRLFHWWTKGCWVRDIALRDSHGTYFFRDEYVNVGALAILRVAGISPNISDATAERATLFSGTSNEVTVAANRDTLVVILPDLTQEQFTIPPGAVIEMGQRVIRAMQRPGGTFSVVEEIYRYAIDIDNRELWSFLEPYRAIRNVQSQDSAVD